MQLLSEFWILENATFKRILGPWKMQLLSEFLGTLENATFACTELRCPLSKIRKPLPTPTTLERYLTPARGKLRLVRISK
jgi:hypothetical protein